MIWDGPTFTWRYCNGLHFLVTDLPIEGISFGNVSDGDNCIVGEKIICSAGGNPGPESYLWTDQEKSPTQVQGQTLEITKEYVFDMVQYHRFNDNFIFNFVSVQRQSSRWRQNVDTLSAPL